MFLAPAPQGSHCTSAGAQLQPFGPPVRAGLLVISQVPLRTLRSSRTAAARTCAKGRHLQSSVVSTSRRSCNWLQTADLHPKRSSQARWTVDRPRKQHSTSAARGEEIACCHSKSLANSFWNNSFNTQCSNAMAASLPSPGVCVLSLAAAQPRVDAAVLEASGLRVRTVSTCVADVMLTSASLAMLVLPAADLEQGASCWDRSI